MSWAYTPTAAAAKLLLESSGGDTALDWGGGVGTNTTPRYYTASIPQLPNADWAVVVWARTPGAAPGSGVFWALFDQMGDASSGPALRLILNGGNAGATFTSIRSSGGTEELLQVNVTYPADVLIVTQRRGSNYEQYVVVEDGTTSGPNATAAVSGTTITSATWRLGSDQFDFGAVFPIGEFAVVLNDSFTAAQVEDLAAGARASSIKTCAVELRFRDGAVATETNLGSEGSASDATRVSTGFTTTTELWPDGTNSYSLTANVATYTLTHNAAGTRAARRVVADPASFALTGNASVLRTARKMTAAPATFSMTGQATGLRATRQISAQPASYGVIANAAGLRRSFTLTAAVTTYTSTAQDAVLRATRRTQAAATGYTVTGLAAALRAARRLLANAVAYSWTTNDATLTYTPNTNRTLTAEPVSFTLTGITVTLRIDRRVAAGSAAFALAGQAATLRAAWRAVTTTANFTWNGQSVHLQSSRRAQASPGSYAWATQDVTLRSQRRAAASFQTYAWTGRPTTLLYSGALPKVLLAQPIVYTCTILNTLLQIERAVYHNPRPPAQVARGAYKVGVGGDGRASFGGDRPARLDSHGKRAMLRP